MSFRRVPDQRRESIVGLFDKITSSMGVGGGTLTVQLQNAQVAPGGTLSGTVTFAGGKRAQNITAIKLSLACNEKTMQKGPNGEMQPQSRSNNIVPAQTVSGPLSIEPGQTQQFPFQIQVPA